MRCVGVGGSVRKVLCGVLLAGLCQMYALPLYKVEGKCVQPKDFNKNQRQVILKAFKYGFKSGFGYTMAAIAWKESCAGEYRVNFADPSAGIYHAYIPGLIRKHKQKDSSFMRNVVGELLMRDDKFASQTALEELNYWQKVRKGNWYEVIKSYNKGFSWEKDKKRNKMAQDYFEDVAKRVKILQEYIPKIAPRDVRNAKNDHAVMFLDKVSYSNISSAPKKTSQTLKTQVSKQSSEVAKQAVKTSSKHTSKTQSKAIQSAQQRPNKNNLPKGFVILEEN